MLNLFFGGYFVCQIEAIQLEVNLANKKYFLKMEKFWTLYASIVNTFILIYQLSKSAQVCDLIPLLGKMSYA